MNRLLIAALATAIAVPAFAADSAANDDTHHRFVFRYPLLASGEDAKSHADAWKRWADDFSREMRTSMGMAFSHRLGPQKVVKGAPYSAEVVTESKQTLADGNVIARKSTGAVYRDGEGRMRQESGGDGKEPSVFILDPVAGKHYVVSPGGKAHVMNVPLSGARDTQRERQVIRTNGTEIRVENGKVFIDGKEAAPGRVETKAGNKTIVVENGRVTIDGKELAAPTPPTPPVGAPTQHREVIVKRVPDADGIEREEVRIQVIRPDGEPLPLPPMPPVPPAPGAAPIPPVPPVPPMPGVQTFRFESPARLGKGVTTSLGSREFDGVKAEGKSTVWTIPAGAIGNANPIQVTSETWTSPDLQVTVYSRYNDPRTGETTYRLAKVKRGEPPADLFKVPESALAKSKSKDKG